MTVTFKKWYEYAEFVTGLTSPSAMQSFDTKLNMGALGLAGEVGEVVKTLTPIVYHNVPVQRHDFFLACVEELGDMYWYSTFLMHNVFHIIPSDFAEYQPPVAEGTQHTLTTRETIIIGLLGLEIHVGAFADMVKKHLFHNKRFTTTVRTNMVKELNDLQQYYDYWCRDILCISLEHIIDCNMAKLSARYSEKKFSVEEFMAKEQRGN